MAPGEQLTVRTLGLWTEHRRVLYSDPLVRLGEIGLVLLLYIIAYFERILIE